MYLFLDWLRTRSPTQWSDYKIAGRNQLNAERTNILSTAEFTNARLLPAKIYILVVHISAALSFSGASNSVLSLSLEHQVKTAEMYFRMRSRSMEILALFVRSSIVLL